MKYSFHPKELNSWKGLITERLIRCYIEDVLIPALRKQGWNDTIFTPYAWFEMKKTENMPPPYARLVWKREGKFFISNGLLPTKELLHAFEKLTRLLENVPDGFLVKLKKTGRTKSLKEALTELGLEKCGGWTFGLKGGAWALGLKNWTEGAFRFERSKHDENELLPIVDGEIEVIEVKSGKSFFPPHQKKSYRNVLENGYPLRFFQVYIVDFERNHFEIEEKLLKKATEIEDISKVFRNYATREYRPK